MFGAGQIRNCYSGMPMYNWHPAALLAVIEQACSSSMHLVDHWLRNCLAFCMIPSDAAAEGIFNSLNSCEFDPALIRANLATVARLQSKMMECRIHAQKGLDILADCRERRAHLWSIEQNLPVLRRDAILYTHLELLASVG